MLHITVNVSFTGNICYLIMANINLLACRLSHHTSDGVGAKFSKHVVPQNQLDSSLQFHHEPSDCGHMIEEKLSHVSIVGFQPALRIFAFAQAAYLNVFYPHKLPFESYRSLKNENKLIVSFFPLNTTILIICRE